MRFLIELYGFPLRTTDLAINVNRSKLFEVPLAEGEPSPPRPWHKLRGRRRVFQLLPPPIPPSHKVEGHRINSAEPPNYKGKPVEHAPPKLKDQPLICRREKCAGILRKKARRAILPTHLGNKAAPGSGWFQTLVFTVIPTHIKSC